MEKEKFYINNSDYEFVEVLSERYGIEPIGYDDDYEDGATVYAEDVSWVLDDYEYEIEFEDFN